MRFIAFSTHILAHRNHDDGTASSHSAVQNRAFRGQGELLRGAARRIRVTFEGARTQRLSFLAAFVSGVTVFTASMIERRQTWSV
jgi:hypothetical protein